MTMQRFANELAALSEADNLRTLPSAVPPQMINLSSNDYLGLNDDASLWDDFMGQYTPGTSSMSSCSSRLLTGNHSEYGCLEEALANMYGRRALVYPSGYHVNIGILPAIMGKNDLIVADKLVHASIIDGIRLSAATTLRFNHNDMKHLQSILQKHRAEYDNCIIVTESIFSMDGDIAPLQAIAELKKQYNAMLYVDEAHAFGVRGANGEGVTTELGLANEADVIVATFGKAIASMGAFAIVGDTLANYLVNTSRSMIFTTGLPPINVAWSRFIVERLPEFAERRANLQRAAQTLANALGTEYQSHIVPYITGSNSSAIQLATALQDGGFYVRPIRYPTVPKGKARLRFSLKANIGCDALAPIAGIIHQNQTSCQ